MNEPDDGRAATQAATGDTKLGPGRRFARRYLVERLLGRGGMGSVWSVLDVDLGERVALKTLDRVDDSAQTVERFRREVRLARRVTHRNVARIFDIGESSGIHYLTMELVDGDSLAGRLRAGPLSPRVTVELALQIARGLESAHGAEIIHRDLKPGNVLLDASSRAVITDFGIACAVTGDVRLTVEGAGFMGTPAYMSPEQVRGDAVDARSDVYALGVMIFEMLTGKLPFSGDTTIALALARLHQPPDDPRKHAAVSDELATLVLDCVALDPTKRPQDARALSDRLGALVDCADSVSLSQQATVTPHAHPTSTPTTAAATGHHTFASTRIGNQGVAVLPFRYRGLAGEEYLAEALTDEVIDLLSRNRGLRVSARGATAKYGPDGDPRAVGRELGVDVVVDGSLQRSADAIRIQARLVAVDTGFQLWSERFDGKLTDVFELQDRIATQIAETLRVQIQTADQRNEVPADAVAMYMRARALMRLPRMGGSGPDGAIGLLEQALVLAPVFRPAIAALAIATERMWFSPAPRAEVKWRERAEAAVQRALAEAPELPETHLAAARVAMQRADYDGAAQSLASALAIAPTFASAHEVLGVLQCEAGRVDEGLRHLRIAMGLDPTLVNANMYEARYHEMRGNPERADAILAEVERRAGAIEMAEIATHARVAAWRGDVAEMRRQRARIAKSEGGGGLLDSLLQCYLGELAPSAALANLRKSIHPDFGPRFTTMALQLSIEMLAHCGDLDQAELLLEEAAAGPLVDLDWLDHCPLFVELRRRPAFVAIRERVRRRAEAIWHAD